MSLPKVLMIGWEYPPHNSGGLGVACQGLTHSLSGANTEIFFTLPYDFAEPVGHMSVIPCTHPQWRSEYNFCDTLPPFFAYDSTPEMPQSLELNAVPTELDLHELPQSHMEAKVAQYAQMVASQKVADDSDIIHAHDWMSFPAGIAVKQKTGKPLIAHVHSTEFDRVPHGSGSAFIKHTEHQGLQAADHIIAVSWYTKRLLQEKYGIPANKITVIHNGIDLPSTTPNPGKHHFAPNRPVVVFMGRLTMQKGAEFYLQVASIVKRSIPDALFIVAGDGDMYKQLLFSAAYDKLTAHVLFTGFIRGRAREALLDRADVFVMPSVSEPFGLVALEAAQRNTPVIVSKTSGVSEVLPSAVAIDFWDIQKMAESIVSLISDKTAAASQSQKQIEEMTHVTWEKAALDVTKLYRTVFLGSR